MYALLYIFEDSLSSATVATPNPALENGRADKHRAIGKRQWRRAAQRNRVRREVASRSCPHEICRGPSVSPGEARIMNEELIRQWNEAPQGAGCESRETCPSGSHKPDEC